MDGASDAPLDAPRSAPTFRFPALTRLDLRGGLGRASAGTDTARTRLHETPTAQCVAADLVFAKALKPLASGRFTAARRRAS